MLYKRFPKKLSIFLGFNYRHHLGDVIDKNSVRFNPASFLQKYSKNIL